MARPRGPKTQKQTHFEDASVAAKMTKQSQKTQANAGFAKLEGTPPPVARRKRDQRAIHLLSQQRASEGTDQGSAKTNPLIDPPRNDGQADPT
jgi:hypothetical protein